MHATGGRIVVNPTFEDWVYEDDEKQSMSTPMKRQITYHVQEEIGHTKPYDDHGSNKGRQVMITARLLQLMDQIEPYQR